jgi:hypothetical protein
MQTSERIMLYTSSELDEKIRNGADLTDCTASAI